MKNSSRRAIGRLTLPLTFTNPTRIPYTQMQIRIPNIEITVKKRALLKIPLAARRLVFPRASVSPLRLHRFAPFKLVDPDRLPRVVAFPPTLLARRVRRNTRETDLAGLLARRGAARRAGLPVTSPARDLPRGSIDLRTTSARALVIKS